MNKYFFIVAHAFCLVSSHVLGSSPAAPAPYIIVKNDHFFVMSIGKMGPNRVDARGGIHINPIGKCYRVDDYGKIHLIWEIRGMYSYRSRVLLANDKKHLIRGRGFYIPKTSVTEEVSETPVLEIYANGKMFKRYVVKDLIPIVDVPMRVGKNPEIIDWEDVKCEYVGIARTIEEYRAHIPPNLPDAAELFIFRCRGEKLAINLADGKIVARWNAE